MEGLVIKDIVPMPTDLTGLDANDLEHLSFGLGRNITNAPDTNLWYIFTLLYKNYGVQYATYYGTTQGIKFRRKSEGTWVFNKKSLDILVSVQFSHSVVFAIP